MSQAFTINLAANEIGELVLKGSCEYYQAEDPDDNAFIITVEIPNEAFNYAANVLKVANSALTVEYSALAEKNNVYLNFKAGGSSPK